MEPYTDVCIWFGWTQGALPYLTLPSKTRFRLDTNTVPHRAWQNQNFGIEITPWYRRKVGHSETKKTERQNVFLWCARCRIVIENTPYKYVSRKMYKRHAKMQTERWYNNRRCPRTWGAPVPISSPWNCLLARTHPTRYGSRACFFSPNARVQGNLEKSPE
jgi:hypothetical protein